MFGDVAHIFVIADDAWYFDAPLARLVSRQQIVEAMPHLADENRHARWYIAKVEIAFGVESLRIECVEDFGDFVAFDGKMIEFPFDAHKEHALDVIDELIDVDDIAAVIGDKARDFGDNPRRIGAMEE